jgi:hypothetical protein
MCIPAVIAEQGLCKNVTASTTTHSEADKVLNISFSMRSMSYQKTDLFIALSLLCSGSVNMLPGHGGVFFCDARVVSKESRRLVLPRTYVFFILKSDSDPLKVCYSGLFF